MSEPSKPKEPDWSGLNLPVLTEVVDESQVPTLGDEVIDIPDFDFSSEMDALADQLGAQREELPAELEIPELSLEDLIAEAPASEEPLLDLTSLPSLDLSDVSASEPGLDQALPGWDAPMPAGAGDFEFSLTPAEEELAVASPEPRLEQMVEPPLAAAAEPASAVAADFESLALPEDSFPVASLEAAASEPADAPVLQAEAAQPADAAFDQATEVQPGPVPMPPAATPFTSISLDSLPTGVLGGGVGPETKVDSLLPNWPESAGFEPAAPQAVAEAAPALSLQPEQEPELGIPEALVGVETPAAEPALDMPAAGFAAEELALEAELEPSETAVAVQEPVPDTVLEMPAADFAAEPSAVEQALEQIWEQPQQAAELPLAEPVQESPESAVAAEALVPEVAAEESLVEPSALSAEEPALEQPEPVAAAEALVPEVAAEESLAEPSLAEPSALSMEESALEQSEPAVAAEAGEAMTELLAEPSLEPVAPDFVAEELAPEAVSAIPATDFMVESPELAQIWAPPPEGELELPEAVFDAEALAQEAVPDIAAADSQAEPPVLEQIWEPSQEVFEAEPATGAPALAEEHVPEPGLESSGQDIPELAFAAEEAVADEVATPEPDTLESAAVVGAGVLAAGVAAVAMSSTAEAEPAPAAPRAVEVLNVSEVASAAAAAAMMAPQAVNAPPGTVAVIDEQALLQSMYEKMLPRMKVELSLWLQDALELQAKQMLSGVMHQLKEDYEMLFGEALKESLRQTINSLGKIEKDGKRDE
ncbi:hypothetical protein [Chromobacterium sp.]|uniref:hypothetical protein n=1 Tax=Chromobacterium sp. TaxID=306190 RepID=UPI0035AD93BC